MEKLATYTDALFISEVSHAVGLPWTLQQYEEDLQLERTIYGVNDFGFIGCHYLFDEAEIMNIAVLPSHQGKGYAKKLWLFLVAKFEEIGVTVCFLEVRQSNQIARRFYEKLGFVCMAKREKYYKEPVEDALIYRWEKV